MARKFTEAQRLAIDTKDKTLLVSAAAGSGKTATLTERIISSLLDEKNPKDICSLLVVTFTNAAAGELRERIAAALTEAIRAGNSSLSRQLHLLPAASICTIDSFCAAVLRENAERVGINPNFRIADEAEAELLLLSVLEGLVSDIYEGYRTDIATAEEFASLTFALTDAKNPAGIYEVFEHIYEKLISTEDGVKSLIPLTNIYKIEAELPPEQRKYGKYIMDSVHSFAEHYLSLLGAIADGSAFMRSTAPLMAVVESDRAFLNSLRAAHTYKSAREILLNMNFATKPRLKDSSAEADEYFYAREKMKNEARSLLSKYFAYTEDMWCELYLGLYEKLTLFYKFLCAFDEAYATEKKKRGICRYSDIERYAYECLWQGGERTDAAKALSDRFTDVYIDEYQDVNNLQNKIFEAVSRKNNRFMVGDIKQSIYGFRSARPEIFAGMRSEFAPIEASETDCASIFMSQNFRSDSGIIDFTNSVFDKIFSVFGKSIGYESIDRLTHSKLSPDAGIYPTVTLFEKNEKELIDEDEDEEQSFGPAEPRFVARRISELLGGGTLADGSPIKPSDIAIVMRSIKGRADVYSEALAELSIPSDIVESKDFFLNGEVLLALCLLNSIDNPRRDIYLAGLMRSPIFGFSADELVKIKRLGAAHTLYESLKKYVADNPDYTRGAQFLARLSAYREIAEGMNVHSLIAKLYRETSLLSLAGEGAKENLILLYDMARRYEGSEFKGLYSFISYINNVINKKTRFDSKKSGGADDAVKIVTVHGSKGLEYPIVFYVDTGRKISDKDSRTRVVYAENFGISMYLRSNSGLALVKNPVREVINAEVAKKNFEEELRVLYVALTRARERLYISGERTRKTEDFDADMSLLRLSLDEYSSSHIKSHLAVMLASGAEYSEEKSADTDESENGKECKEKVAKDEDYAEISSSCDVDYDELVKRFSFEYPNKYLTEIPEKLSVSSLYPEVLDGTEGSSVTLSDISADELKPTENSDSENDGAPHKRYILPQFIGGRTKAEASAFSGIATHLYLQFCDIDRLLRLGAEAELSTLVSGEFLSADEAAAVRLDEIEKFKKSELISRMQGAKRIWRELRFNIRLPAENFSRDPQRRAAVSGKKILVQGVIDCIIENPDGTLSLIDYKTDRLTEGELRDKALATEKLLLRHQRQLSYYREAVTKMFGKAPSSVEIYSLPLGECVRVE